MKILNKIYNWLQKLFQPIHDFIIKYHDHPAFWIGILIGGSIIFSIVYDALKKD